MNILCLLQNAWGDYDLPIIFEPNPYNKSARQLQRMVGQNNTIFFANTTNEVVEHSYERAEPNHEHFKKLLKILCNSTIFDMMIVCGRQAESMVTLYNDEITIPYIVIPHPNKRGMTTDEINYNTSRVRDMMLNINNHVTFD